MRGNELISRVEGILSRGQRDRDLESAQTLSESRKLHAYLDKKAEPAFQGDCVAHQEHVWHHIKKIGKERVHREESSQKANFTSAFRALSHLRNGTRRRNLASRKMLPQSIMGLGRKRSIN